MSGEQEPGQVKARPRDVVLKAMLLGALKWAIAGPLLMWLLEWGDAHLSYIGPWLPEPIQQAGGWAFFGAAAGGLAAVRRSMEGKS